jgi:hypothetical protein
MFIAEGGRCAWMRTKRGLPVVLALIACLAVGSATIAMGKTKKKRISTTISMTVTTTNAGPYTEASARAYGNVSARGPKGCTKGRRVVIFRNGLLVATVLTGKGGAYSVTFTGSSSGNWQAGVTDRKIKKKKKHKKYICKLAATGVVVTP